MEINDYMNTEHNHPLEEGGSQFSITDARDLIQRLRAVGISLASDGLFPSVLSHLGLSTDHEQTGSLNHKLALAYRNKGDYFSLLERYEEALVAYDQALRLDPDNAVAYCGKGHILCDLNRYEEALATYDQALHLDPDLFTACAEKGNALCDMERYEEALAAYDQALYLDPNDATTLRKRGNALCDMERYEEALAAYDQALCLDSYSAPTYQGKSAVLFYLARYEEALAAYDQALHLDPAITMVKDIAEALRSYKQAHSGEYNNIGNNDTDELNQEQQQLSKWNSGQIASRSTEPQQRTAPSTMQPGIVAHERSSSRMDRQGRILIVDDMQTWREELVNILQHDGFHADAVSGTSEALTQLNKSYYHVLVVDIHLDRQDTPEIELLRELDRRGLSEATRVIMLSAYSRVERLRTAFRDYKVADFLSKDEFTVQNFLESVQWVLSKTVNINQALDIHWQAGSSPEQVVLGLEVEGMRIRKDTPLQSQVAAELEDLLCRLFYRATSVLIQPLSSGRSGMGVLRVEPFYGTKGGGYPVIAKCGGFRQIEEEYNNFKEYVEPFLGGGRNTAILDVGRTPHLGGLVYSLPIAAHGQMIDFGEFYHRNDVSWIKEVLDQLFLKTCGSWYANHGCLQPLDLTAEYQRLLGYKQEEFEQILSRRLKSGRGKHALTFNSLNSERTFTNPVLAIANQKFIRSTYVCTTHGDFNPHNLLVDRTDNIWLIDFQDTTPSHILRDVATLDSAVRFQLLTAQEATLEERLSMEEVLSSIEGFSKVKDLEARFSTVNLALAKAYNIVVHLRMLAYQLIERNLNDDISEYYIALLYNALNTLRFSSLQQVQHEHALLSASLLADRLGVGL